jgi:radical SAM superfamily enzyme YgiQ (UPF0313 family)
LAEWEDAVILFIEPICKNTDNYVPAYPLPIMEIASFVKTQMPQVEIKIVSMPVDYGLPLTILGKEQIYHKLLEDLSEMKPTAVGISCTAIAQAEETIYLCEFIREHHPDILLFVGGYFPTIYYEELLSRTSAVDVIVIGEGEVPTLKIIECLEKGKNPVTEDIPNLAWKQDGLIRVAEKNERFDLKKKAILDLGLLRYPTAYSVLPYAFSRGCPHQCSFCMEEFIRPIRREVPSGIVRKDLKNLSLQSGTRTLLVSDALFKSFDSFPFIESLDMKVHFETRCDTLDPSLIPKIAGTCGILAFGFESASYSTLRRMNKVRDRSHYKKYVSNMRAIFKVATQCEVPIMVFMIAGYPGDAEEDLKESLLFAKELSKNSGSGGHVFKIGECRVYPKTKIYNLALSSPDVVFDDAGVFGDNVVRQPSKDLDFKTIVAYMTEIFGLSNNTPKLQSTMLNLMPFFRLPARALRDDMIPTPCFSDSEREIFNAKGESLSTFRQIAPRLYRKHKKDMSGQRSMRALPL